MIKLEIYSDPVCPWCMIGKSRLERALESRPDHPFIISWHPFQLNPDMPPGGMARDEYMALKFGPPEQVIEAYRPVIQAAEALGLDLNLPAITHMPNTADAHRLIHWAGLEGRQNAAVNALFRAFFQKGQNIGDHAVLLDIAESVGLSRDLVARLLDSDADLAAVHEADRAARRHGIRAVPCFIIGGEYAVSGAQDTSLWCQIIDEMGNKA